MPRHIRSDLQRALARSDRKMIKKARALTLPAEVEMRSDKRIVRLLSIRGKYCLIVEPTGEPRRVALLALRLA